MSIGFPHREHIWQTSLGYLHVREENWRVGTVWLHVLHGVPLVDAGLVGGDPALIVADPGEEQAAWKVVMTTGHLAGFMEWLEGWPVRKKTKKTKTWLLNEMGKNRNQRTIEISTAVPIIQYDSPHGLHRNRLEYMHPVVSWYTETPVSRNRGNIVS